ncbi:MAG: signal recognition particle protein [Bacillota bacterium]|nr:signal recognition particle protein [Bacillota bacterium]
MLFESLSDKLNAAFKRLRSKGKLTEADVKEAMREVKLALLAADVNIKVVKEFVNRTTERAVGEQVLESLTPAQQIIKIVNDELCEIMGKTQSKLEISPAPPTIVMMVGLQGSGKTTHSGKLALHLKKQGKRPLLAACDIYRPAAVKQLQIVGENAGVPVFSMPEGTSAVTIAKEAVAHSKKHGNDIIILDTAGRLHIDEAMMNELKDVKKAINPIEILLVVDAMTGQDAVNVSSAFNEALGITGVVLTKTDGDTRGGAALSVKYVTGKPIKFVGTGEKLDNLEPFYPDRMANRILGMGDVLTLIEKAEQAFDEKKAVELEKKIREQSFDLGDFYEQMQQMKNMGPLDQIAGMIPGVNSAALKDAQIDNNLMKKAGAIIESMTPKERANPDLINGSRRLRIAKGSGTQVSDVNLLLKRFDMMKKMMKQFGGGKMPKRGKFRLPF